MSSSQRPRCILADRQSRRQTDDATKYHSNCSGGRRIFGTDSVARKTSKRGKMKGMCLRAMSPCDDGCCVTTMQKQSDGPTTRQTARCCRTSSTSPVIPPYSTCYVRLRHLRLLPTLGVDITRLILAWFPPLSDRRHQKNDLHD